MARVPGRQGGGDASCSDSFLAIPFAGECKRLYVQPAARGRHIADLLLDAQEEFARSQGLRWMYLDSYDDLKVAIALYRKRGYVSCPRYNEQPAGHVFLRKNIVPGRENIPHNRSATEIFAELNRALAGVDMPNLSNATSPPPASLSPS